MDFRNRTEHAADMLRASSARSQDHMLACFIARPTYRLVNGSLVAAEEPWPIDPAPFETPLGLSSGDKPFYSGGIDVLVGGQVRQPRGSEARLDVEIAVGRAFRRRIAVIGDRVWKRDAAGALVPGEPAPFLTMPLTYERAFGGAAPTEHGVDMPYQANPLGRGFYLDEASAEGQPLPNLEDPASPVRGVHDMPEPVGLGYYPLDGSLRPLSALDHPLAMRAPGAPARDEPPRPIEPGDVLPTLFNAAHPRMILAPGKGPAPGDLVRLSHGMRDGDLAFTMPDLSMHAHVQLEDREHVFPLHLDQIGLVGGEGLVFFSLRCVVEYRVRKGERRATTLYPGAVPALIPASYRIAWPDRFADQQGREDA